MREHYDFSKMKGRKNPYLKQLKKSSVPLWQSRLTDN